MLNCELSFFSAFRVSAIYEQIRKFTFFSLEGALTPGRFSTYATMKECVNRLLFGLADCSGCHLNSLCSPATNLAVNLR